MKDKKKAIIGGIIGIIVALVALFGIGISGDETNTSTTATQDTTVISEQGSSEFSDTDEEGSVDNSDSESESVEANDVTDSNIGTSEGDPPESVGSSGGVNISSVPSYSGSPYVAINNNIPTFSSAELTTTAYESYSPLDSLGRCGEAIASCGKEIMPKEGEERGSISAIKPSGWVQASYDIVSGNYLYNRCHLIGWQLSAENANNKNLITGTRYMNTEGMLPFENMVADYIRETGNHVAYRVTPIYSGNNLVASGVQLEAYSIEDEGDGVCFNVYVYNVQPGITINYSTGTSYLTNTSTEEKVTEAVTEEVTQTDNNTSYYVLNTNSKKFHYPDCSSVKNMSEKNYAESNLSRDALMAQGYTPCGNCDP